MLVERKGGKVLVTDSNADTIGCTFPVNNTPLILLIKKSTGTVRIINHHPQISFRIKEKYVKIKILESPNVLETQFGRLLQLWKLMISQH